MSDRERAITAAMTAYRTPTRDGALVNDMRAAIDAYEAAMRKAGYVLVPVGLLSELASDLEAELNTRYPESSRKYPSEERRYNLDMEPVRNARAMIKAHTDSQ